MKETGKMGGSSEVNPGYFICGGGGGELLRCCASLEKVAEWDGGFGVGGGGLCQFFSGIKN